MAEGIPAELDAVLKAHRRAKKVFDSLPPSHRREYATYVNEAKKPETRERRARRCIQMLERGTGSGNS